VTLQLLANETCLRTSVIPCGLRIHFVADMHTPLETKSQARDRSCTPVIGWGSGHAIFSDVVFDPALCQPVSDILWRGVTLLIGSIRSIPFELVGFVWYLHIEGESRTVESLCLQKFAWMEGTTFPIYSTTCVCRCRAVMLGTQVHHDEELTNFFKMLDSHI
jgi:hypothetical protein